MKNTEFESRPRPEVLVIGHQNPDTDSICSAIAYAALKNALDDGETYIPCRAGNISEETAWVLRRFQLPEPRLAEDVAPTIRDVEIRRIPGVDGELTVKDAWAIMRDGDITTLPIVDGGGYLEGLISLKDLAVAQMDILDNRALSRAGTRYSSVARTLTGSIAAGSPDAVVSGGRILIGAGTAESIREAVQEGDVVMVANRESAQRSAIEGGAGCLVVCLGGEILPSVRAMAEERGCVILSTPLDTYRAAYFINQSVPIRHYMVRRIDTFTLSTPLEDAMRVMGGVRHVYFPVLDDAGKYYGVISRRNLINRRRKQLVLVDHNEKTQCVPGWEQAEIREIVDHHRIGGMQTITPIFFRNQPVGSTATIVAAMYREQGRIPEKEIAGALCCAILSDTLMFRSPTCTDADRGTAAELAALAGADMFELGEAMFEAGEDLTGKSAEQLLTRDYKEFAAGKVEFGVGQASFLSAGARRQAAALTAPELDRLRKERGMDHLFFLLTDISSGSSDVLCAGPGAEALLREAFALPPEAPLTLPGVVSRKKQFIPAVMETLHRLEERKG